MSAIRLLYRHARLCGGPDSSAIPKLARRLSELAFMLFFLVGLQANAVVQNGDFAGDARECHEKPERFHDADDEEGDGPEAVGDQADAGGEHAEREPFRDPVS